MKREIEIEGLPEGWEAVAYRQPKAGEYFLSMTGIKYAETDRGNLWLIVRSTRRIILEETCEEDRKAFLHAGKYWKIVEDGK